MLTRFSAFLPALLVAGALLLGPAEAAAQTTGQEVPVQPGDSGEFTFSTENGPQFIVVRDFRITEVHPTGKPDEYALTLLALTQRGEPDQRVMGGILFEIDGKSTLVPFQQGGVGDVIVTAQPDADEITLRAVDSNVTHKVDLPGSSRTPWLLGGGIIVVLVAVMARRRRLRRAAEQKSHS